MDGHAQTQEIFPKITTTDIQTFLFTTSITIKTYTTSVFEENTGREEIDLISSAADE